MSSYNNKPQTSSSSSFVCPPTPIRKSSKRQLSLPVTTIFQQELAYLNFDPEQKQTFSSDSFKKVKLKNSMFAEIYVAVVVPATENKKYVLKIQRHNPSYTWRQHMIPHWNVLRKIQAFGMENIPGLNRFHAAWCEIDSNADNYKYPEVCYFLMDYCDAGDLGGINLNVQNQELFIWKLIYDVARTLLAFESLNLVHMDIKPQNLLMNINNKYQDPGSFVFQLCDLGHMIDLDIVKTSSQVLAEGDHNFLAPELLQNNAIISGAIDRYSLGATCFVLLTGAEKIPKLENHDFQQDFSLLLQHQSISDELKKTIMQLCELEAKTRISLMDLIAISQKSLL